MQIKCPECDAKLALGQPKPGRYRPNCKQCGKPFLIQVGEGDPPKVAVGKLKPKAAPDQQPSAPKQVLDSESGTKTQKSTAAVDATIDSAVGGTVAARPSASQSGNTDATMDSVANPTSKTARDVDATMDSVVQAAASQTAGGADATMDQTLAGGSSGDASQKSAAPSESAKSARVKIHSGQSATPQQSAAAGKAVVSAGSAAAKPGKSKSDELAAIPERLGGYKILRVLGRGAMGAVYEAKQISLDRLVALKTIRGRLAENAASLARFTREAYAAAQLTHHNVVQIYDFGEDGGKHFFSMEWVRGGPLSDLIRDKGPIEPKLAVGYMLQAARGLQFAHRHGMVHRDIKPANLLLSDDGVVKVADLGLVKIPDQIDPDPEVGTGSVSGLQSGTQVTMQGTAVGTPAYMAPEQGIDAASVDHRADIYSLGCSLFYLLAGKPPFEGSVVSEVLEQHAKQELPKLSAINARIPDQLQNIIERAMAKRPDDRYDSLAEMIADMESFLGISSEGEFSPTAAQADQWEQIAKKFQTAAPLFRLAGPAFVGFAALCGLLTLVMPLLGIAWLLSGPAMFASGVATAIILGSAASRSAVANSFRRWFSSLSWFDYLVASFGTIIFVLVVFVAGGWPGLLAGAIAGGIAAAVYHFALVAPSLRSQSDATLEAEKFIRDLRIEGADEEGIRSFAARYAGKHWQRLYEALFGYSALCAMREQLKIDRTFSGSTKSGLRDRVCASFLSKAEANQQARDLKRLTKIEERGLASEGVSAAEAHAQALEMASAIIEDAKRQAAAIASSAGSDTKAAVEAKRARQKAMMAEARSGKYAKKRDPLAPLRFALGGQTRLLAGCILLGIFAIRVGLVDTAQNLDVQAVNTDQLAAQVESIPETDIPFGIAGLLLFCSAFVSGWRMSPFALVATVVILFCPPIEIGLEIIRPWMVATAIGVIIYIPGVLFGESKEAF